MKSFIKILIPDFIIDLYKKQRRKRNTNYREELAKAGQVVTEQQIAESLIQNGLKSGDTVMLHSSLSSLGNVENGSITIINAFKKVIGSDGTLVMPSFPAIGYNYDYLSTDPVFDIKNTPSKMGVITEVFRKLEGVKRSFHPTDPVCALGKQAEYLTKDHFGQITPYNEFSPFYKLTLIKAKIVLIGVRLDTVTNFHTIEDAIPDFKFPVYHSKIYTARMVNEDGKEMMMQTKVHDPLFSKKRKCNAFQVPFEKSGFLKEFKIGMASCMIIDAAEMHNWLIQNYKKGITIYTPNGEKLN